MAAENHKRKIVQLVREWRERTDLKIEQVLKLMRDDKDFGLHRVGKKITRAQFEAKFIQKADVHSRYDFDEIYALIAAFSRGSILEPGCTAEEAVKVCLWAAAPIDRQKLDMLFGRQAVETAINTIFQSGATQQKRWTLSGSMADARNLHGVCLLTDGTVLVTGGRNSERSGEPLASTEIYAPNRGTWSDVGTLNMARFWFSIVRLNTGKVLVAGGTDDAEGEGFASAEVYDPKTGRWTLTGSMQQARRLAAHALMADGRVLVAGGAHGRPDRNRYLKTVEIYDPLAEQWSPANSMIFARDNARAVRLHDGRILVVGGEGPDGHVQAAEIYDPVSGLWTLAGQLSLGRSNSAVTLLTDGSVLVAGGASNLDRKFHDTVDIYNPTTNAWTLAAPMQTKRYTYASVLLPDNRVLVTGGINAMGILRSTEVYDPDTDSWILDGEMQIERVGHHIVTLANGDILAVGGLSSLPSHSASTELYR